MQVLEAQHESVSLDGLRVVEHEEGLGIGSTCLIWPTVFLSSLSDFSKLRARSVFIAGIIND